MGVGWRAWSWGAALAALLALAACRGAVDEERKPTVGDQQPSSVAERAVADLATRLGLPAAAVAVLEARPVQWPDACLGVHYPDRLCAQVVTPGYWLRLSAGGQEYRYHSDARDQLLAVDFIQGATIRGPLDLSVAPVPTPPQARLVTSRGQQEGGIGSYCWAEGGAGVCVDKVGLPVPKAHIVAQGGERLVFNLGFQPSAASLSAWPLAAGQVVEQAPGEPLFLWRPAGQEALAQELTPRASPELVLGLAPGRYVLMLSAMGDAGDVVYGFLVEIAAG